MKNNDELCAKLRSIFENKFRKNDVFNVVGMDGYIIQYNVTDCEGNCAVDFTLRILLRNGEGFIPPKGTYGRLPTDYSGLN